MAKEIKIGPQVQGGSKIVVVITGNQPMTSPQPNVVITRRD